MEKLLEDAQIKLSVVASDIFGVSGRAIMAALIAGQRDPKALAQMARDSKNSDTESPSNPPPDPHPRARRFPAPLRSAGSCRLPGHPPFSS